jgi:peptidoglycan/xylan/chitin deacetylase (PgdA/CDA1 family)
MKKSFFLLPFFCLWQFVIFCQTDGSVVFPNGAKAAICLTYDDGLSSHVNTAAPMLDKYGFKGTFFVTVGAVSVREEMDKWRDLPNRGHELANHSAYHPCRKSLPGMDWVQDYYDLDRYTVAQVLAEIQLSNSFLQALDGKKNRTFAYPCAHLTAGGLSYKDSISHYATASRGVSDFNTGLVLPLKIDLDNVPSWAPSGVNGTELIAYVQKVIENQALSTFCFHGIGAEHLTVSTEAHEELLRWLAANKDKIWVATFKEATDFLINLR